MRPVQVQLQVQLQVQWRYRQGLWGYWLARHGRPAYTRAMRTIAHLSGKLCRSNVLFGWVAVRAQRATGAADLKLAAALP
jgi:hypothetical protein